MSTINDNKIWPLLNFETFEKQLNGQAESPLHDLRKKAIERFSEMGFPTMRKEAWRFTNISPVEQQSFKLDAGDVPVSLDEIKPFLLNENDPVQLVFVNGVFKPELSEIHVKDGIVVQNLGQAIKDDPERVLTYLKKNENVFDYEFSALNTAFMKEGAFIYIPKNVVFDKPIHLLYISRAKDTEIVSHPRNLIVAETNSQATIMESYAGWNNEVYFSNPVTDVVLGENAIVHHYKVQRESEKAYHIALQHIHQERSSHFASYSFSIGAAISRNDIHNVLDGEGCDSVLNGLYLAHDRQVVDTHSLIDHAQPHCNSREVYHGILDDKAKTVFSGKIHVRKDAQKTDAIQSNKNILLSEEATVDTQPQLEIFADDVRCTHGGTVGQIDNNGVFYLRSRGIGEIKARNIMIHAFAGEIFNEVKFDSVRELMDDLVLSHLEDGHLKHS